MFEKQEMGLKHLLFRLQSSDEYETLRQVHSTEIIKQLCTLHMNDLQRNYSLGAAFIKATCRAVEQFQGNTPPQSEQELILLIERAEGITMLDEPKFKALLIDFVHDDFLPIQQRFIDKIKLRTLS